MAALETKVVQADVSLLVHSYALRDVRPDSCLNLSGRSYGRCLRRTGQNDGGDRSVFLSSRQWRSCVEPLCSHKCRKGRSLLQTLTDAYQKDSGLSLNWFFPSSSQYHSCSRPVVASVNHCDLDFPPCNATSRGTHTRREQLVGLLSIASTTWACELVTSGWPGLSEARADVGESANAIKEASPLQNLLSVFDTYEETQSGRKLPKAYLKSAREVVRTLKEALMEESSQGSKYRRATESAKEAIREYLGAWKGVSTVTAEESYMELEVALRELSAFYSKGGPRAVMPQNVKDRLLLVLESAQAAL